MLWKVISSIPFKEFSGNVGSQDRGCCENASSNDILV